MFVRSIREARARLSAPIERAQKGEEIIIAEAGRPVAVLRAYSGTAGRRIPGALRGRIRIAPDFDVLPAEIAEAMGSP